MTKNKFSVNNKIEGSNKRDLNNINNISNKPNTMPMNVNFNNISKNLKSNDEFADYFTNRGLKNNSHLNAINTIKNALNAQHSNNNQSIYLLNS